MGNTPQKLFPNRAYNYTSFCHMCATTFMGHASKKSIGMTINAKLKRLIFSMVLIFKNRYIYFALF